jgi:hypothetical protein
MNHLMALVFLLQGLWLTSACFPDDGTLVTVGEETSVCLLLSRLEWGAHAGNSNSGEFHTVKASLKADEFSVIKTSNSWTGVSYADDKAMIDLKISDSTAGNGLGVAVGSLGMPSYQKAYRLVASSTSSVTFPVLMAVIRVEEGKVMDITWDDTCDWCSADRCAANTYNYKGEAVLTDSKACYFPDDECVRAGTATQVPYLGNQITQIESKPECDLKVYVTWTGTDSKGFHFLSAATRFSRLNEAQVKSIVAP